MQENAISTLAASIADAIARAPPAARHDAALDALDLLAVLADGKPLAMFGCGSAPPPWFGDVEPLLHVLDVSFGPGPMWVVGSEIADLPDWYAGPLVDARRGIEVLYVGRPELVNHAMGGLDVIDEATEAARLGYPSCCVGAFHRRRRRYHDLTMATIAHFSGLDEEKMRRFAAAEVVLQPQSSDERRQLREALHCHMAPFTSVRMCIGCRGEPDRPAMQLSRRRAKLARRHGIDSLLTLRTTEYV